MPMDWVKSPESLVQTFAEALPEAPTVERRKMFGFPPVQELRFFGLAAFFSLGWLIAW